MDSDVINFRLRGITLLGRERERERRGGGGEGEGERVGEREVGEVGRETETESSSSNSGCVSVSVRLKPRGKKWGKKLKPKFESGIECHVIFLKTISLKRSAQIYDVKIKVIAEWFGVFVHRSTE